MGWIIGTSLIGGGLNLLPANAQTPNQSDITGTSIWNNTVPINQSDITGTNIWNNSVPIFENGGRLSPEILDNARQLAQELEDASNRCRNAIPPAAAPRRFARGSANPNANPNEVCIHPDCQRLNSLVEETRAFLSDVNRSQVEQQRASRNRTW